MLRFFDRLRSHFTLWPQQLPDAAVGFSCTPRCAVSEKTKAAFPTTWGEVPQLIAFGLLTTVITNWHTCHRAETLKSRLLTPISNSLSLLSLATQSHRKLSDHLSQRSLFYQCCINAKYSMRPPSSFGWIVSKYSR